jgi:CheY-like chemotaxis protein
MNMPNRPKPDKSTSQYLNDIAHDFNNILTTIINNIGMAMLHVEDTKKVLLRLEEIEKSSLKARDLIQQLLILAEITDDKHAKTFKTLQAATEKIQIDKTGRILLVDDDETILDTIGEFLATWGYEVTIAQSGELAIEEYKKNHYDVVIIDLTMPNGISGIETLQTIRLKIDPKVKAIISSGYAKDPVMVLYENYGFMDALIKPYRIDELVNKINKLLISS